MLNPQLLNISRHDSDSRTLITLTGEIDLTSAPVVRDSLARCLRDGFRTIDVDLTRVVFCDGSGINAFLDASWQIAAAGGSLRLQHLSPILGRLFTLSGYPGYS